MILQAGSIIKSTKALNNSYFESGTILLTEYNSNGAVGFIINRPSTRNLNQLEEFKSGPSFALYEGGIVDQEHLFFIHNKPQLIHGGLSLKNDIYFGGDFKQAIAGITAGHLTINNMKIFIGYCGWDAGELESEIDEGSWIIDYDRMNIFL